MGQENTINLIEEISENQKNNDFIIFTTFRFDPYLFDNYLFNKLRMNNPTSEIIVILDADQYEEAFEKFTKITGCNYHLVPIFLKMGVFHPKVFVFISTDKKKATAYVGSANLTTSGFTRNAEIVTKIDFDENNQDSFWISLHGFFNGLTEAGFIDEKKVKGILDIAFRSVIQLEEPIQSGDCQLIHNLTFPILHQVLDQIENQSFSELTVFAPFFSQDPSVMKTICERVNVKKIRLVLQKNNHNLQDIKPYLNFFSSKSIPCKVCEIEYPDDENRKFHSKLIYFSGDEEFLLVGSPNITQRALLSTAENGNIECGIFITGNRAKNVIRQINFYKSKNPDELVNSGSPIQTGDTKPLLKIYSADYDEDMRNLHVKTESISEDVIVKLYLEKQSEPESHEINLKEGEFNLSKISNGIPTQIIIKSQERVGKRRIFYDRSYYFRTIASDPESIQKIADRFSLDCTLDQSDINAIIIGLAKRLSIPNDDGVEEATKNGKGKKPPNRHAGPSPVRASLSHTRSILKELDQLTRLVDYLEKMRFEIDTEDPDKIIDIEIKIENTKIYRKKIADNVTKFINTIDKTVYSVFLISNKKDINEFVDSQISFLGIILRRVPNLIGMAHFPLIEEILETNFSNTKLKKCSEETSINIFKHLLIINYCYNYQFLPRFMREIFNCNDFFTPAVYEEIKKFLLDFSEQYLPDRITFNQQRFLESFCSMISFTFDSKSISLMYLSLVSANSNK